MRQGCSRSLLQLRQSPNPSAIPGNLIPAFSHQWENAPGGFGGMMYKWVPSSVFTWGHLGTLLKHRADPSYMSHVPGSGFYPSHSP